MDNNSNNNLNLLINKYDIGSERQTKHMKSKSSEDIDPNFVFDEKEEETISDVDISTTIETPRTGARFFSSMFSGANENKTNKNGPEKVASSVLNTFEKEREWGIFCMENKTDKPIYWGVKGLHIHWKKENSPIILNSKTSAPCDYPPAYYFYNQPTEKRSQNSKFKSHRHFCFSSCHTVDLSNEGLPDWNNIIKYKLEPNNFCLGRFPFHTYSDYFILVVGLYDSEMNSSTNTTPPTVDKENIFSKYFGNARNSFNGNNLPKTQTSVELFDENDDSPDKNKEKHDKTTRKKSPFHCKAYFIEHFHNKDVILGANVNKSLFLFSDYSTFTLEPITYRFFPNYRPCENTSIDAIKLSNNIYYDEIREISIRKGHKKKVSEGASRNALQFHGLQMYEDEATNTLRESILFFFLFLRKLDERLNILLLLDISEIEQTEQYLGGNLMEYLMKFLIGSTTITHTESQKGYLIQWFQSCVKLIGYNIERADEENRYVLFRRDDVCSRSFSMYKFKETSTETEDFFKNEEDEELSKRSIEPHSNVDGVIVLSTVGNKMERGLKDKLKLLEGFPTLFVLHGLDKCTDIYDAIKRKEDAEIEISSLYSNSKPFIVQHKSAMTKSQTASTELILSQFFREVIDVALERVTVQHPKQDSSTSINTVMKLFSNSEVKIEIKDLQEYEQKRNIWFFGLDNERETVSVAVNSFYSAKSYLESKAKKNQKQTNNILICVRNREQFMNGKDIIPEKKIQSVNNYVVVRRTITDLWTGMNAPTKRRRSTDSSQTSMKKSQSYGTLQSLSRKERAKKLKSFRTSVETPQLLPLPNDKGIFEMQNTEDSDDSDTETSTISNASASFSQNHESSDDEEFDENAIVLVKNDSEEEDKKPEDINLKQNVNNEKKTSCYPIQKGDVVVLCLELSGRILITGENGVYSRFIQEILTYTDKIVLFVERMDRREFNQPATIRMKPNATSKKICCVFGDEEDMKLDEELCQSQDMKNLKYRCYYFSERAEDKNHVRKFWESVLHGNCTKMESQ